MKWVEQFRRLKNITQKWKTKFDLICLYCASIIISPPLEIIAFFVVRIHRVWTFCRHRVRVHWTINVRCRSLCLWACSPLLLRSDLDVSRHWQKKCAVYRIVEDLHVQAQHQFSVSVRRTAVTATEPAAATTRSTSASAPSVCRLRFISPSTEEMPNSCRYTGCCSFGVGARLWLRKCDRDDCLVYAHQYEGKHRSGAVFDLWRKIVAKVLCIGTQHQLDPD